MLKTYSGCKALFLFKELSSTKFESPLISNLELSVKSRKGVVKQNKYWLFFRLSCSLILQLYCVKDLRFLKFFRRIKFRETWGELEARKKLWAIFTKSFNIKEMPGPVSI